YGAHLHTVRPARLSAQSQTAAVRGRRPDRQARRVAAESGHEAILCESRLSHRFLGACLINLVRLAARAVILASMCALSACTALPSVDSPEEYLDPDTAATISVV